MKSTLSVVMITKNEEKNIERCLEQVKWADEIIIVDAFSKDRTVEIAKRYTDKVTLRKWTGFPDQRSFALDLATQDFVLILDADEVLDIKIRNEIRDILSSKKQDFDGYFIKFKIYFLGRTLSFSEKPYTLLRLFKRGRGFVSYKPGQRVHETYGVRGRTKLLDGVGRHYTSTIISERLNQINKYSTLWAEEQIEFGVKRSSVFKIVFITTKSFIGNFFIRCGFLDRFPGFIWCTLKALENFLKYAKLYFMLD